MKGNWFKSKRYGWGWYPATWEGWVVLFVYMSLIAWDFYRIDLASHSVSDTLIAFVPDFIGVTLVLLLLCYRKGERPRWRWG